MKAAFYGCTNLSILATDAPDLSNVENMSYMFKEASSLNSLIGHWDVSNAVIMREMFRGAKSFNQDIGDWNVSNVTYAGSMLYESGLSSANYDSLLIGWSGQALKSNVTLGASGLTYCKGDTARQYIIDTYGWRINDNGKVYDSTSARITDLSLTEEEAISTPSISIYPNPSNGSFEVSFGELEGITWELTDLAGKRLNVSSTNRPGKVEIDATTLGNGVYLLTVTSSLGKITERIVILK